MKDKYIIDFKEAMEILVNGGWVKGSGFAKNCYLKCEEEKGLLLVDISNTFPNEMTFNMLKSLSRQKFRQINVATHKELSY